MPSLLGTPTLNGTATYDTGLPLNIFDNAVQTDISGTLAVQDFDSDTTVRIWVETTALETVGVDRSTATDTQYLGERFVGVGNVPFSSSKRFGASDFPGIGGSVVGQGTVTWTVTVEVWQGNTRTDSGTFTTTDDWS